jgi:hypothetical protein
MGSTGSRARSSTDWSLWRRWVVANAVGEGVGLGGSFLVGAGLVALLQAHHGPWVEIGLALVAVALGTLCEGVIVGHAQWRVLRRVLPALSRRAWVRATAVGAGVAWLLGMIPSTVMSLVSDPARPPAAAGEAAGASEPGALVVYLAAAGMGLVLGPILAAAQYVVLRRHVAAAGWWIPASAAAWMLALPLTFLGPSLMFDVGLNALGVAILLAAVVAAGAVVGAVHGLVLVRLVARG